MSEEKKETLNKVDEKISATTENEIKYIAPERDLSGTYYKSMIKEVNQYEKGEIFTQQEVIALIRKHYENL